VIHKEGLYLSNGDMLMMMEERERYIPLMHYSRRGKRGISNIPPRCTFYQNYLARMNTADVTGGKPIIV
jgi:hypothetical protein